MSARETADLESLVTRCPPLAEGVQIKGERRDDGYYATVVRDSSGFACTIDDSTVGCYFLEYPDGNVGAELSIEHHVVEGFLQRLGREPLYLYEERTWPLSVVHWLEFGDGHVPSAFIGRNTTIDRWLTALPWTSRKRTLVDSGS
ncbi:hypothetical protein [Agrococcus baldri]|uniref:Uncharacterized protein n=1 Tax=Agrococcus baldri TaxID=153730 RepID=A0AA87RH68_9MICO|nr:hypothetical protein [Agrococcus baldri]GEK79413.1 hypothetical protein ABA31_07640 [Agrococcus baldri]